MMSGYKKILVPVDGSKTAEAVLPEVEKMAKVFGSHIYLLQVVNALNIPYFPYTDGRAYETELNKEAQKYLTQLEERLKKKGLSVESVILFGNEAHEILSFSEKNKMDLIAMASHGYSMIERWLLGSVAQKVLHHAAQPVLLIRAPINKPKKK